MKNIWDITLVLTTIFRNDDNELQEDTQKFVIHDAELTCDLSDLHEGNYPYEVDPVTYGKIRNHIETACNHPEYPAIAHRVDFR